LKKQVLKALFGVPF